MEQPTDHAPRTPEERESEVAAIVAELFTLQKGIQRAVERLYRVTNELQDPKEGAP